MGNICTSVQFVVDETIEGQDAAALDVFNHLDLNKQDVDKLYYIFRMIDRDCSGTISNSEVFGKFGLQGTKLEKKIFSFFDEGKPLLKCLECKLCSLYQWYL